MNCKPKPRRIIRKKPQKSRTLWRSGRIIKKGHDMKQLRNEAFERSGGYCENQIHNPRCPRRIFWDTFELHHITPRGRNGSDVLENVLALSRECHAMEHGQGSGKVEAV